MQFPEIFLAFFTAPLLFFLWFHYTLLFAVCQGLFEILCNKSYLFLHFICDIIAFTHFYDIL